MQLTPFSPVAGAAPLARCCSTSTQPVQSDGVIGMAVGAAGGFVGGVVGTAVELVGQRRDGVLGMSTTRIVSDAISGGLAGAAAGAGAGKVILPF